MSPKHFLPLLAAVLVAPFIALLAADVAATARVKSNRRLVSKGGTPE